MTLYHGSNVEYVTSSFLKVLLSSTISAQKRLLKLCANYER